jgi:hypothetical protein
MNMPLEIPEIPLHLAPHTPQAKDAIGFKWAGGEIGHRSKIGGKPDWIQGTPGPKCSCGELMTFYGQLDSIGDRFNLADCGMIYVFVCFDCFETQSVLETS